MPDVDPAVQHAERLHKAVQVLGVPGETRRCVLVAVAVVCDWIDEDGNRRLTQTATPGTPIWQRDGLLHAGLCQDWPDDEDGD